jgi:hypothetical protein
MVDVLQSTRVSRHVQYLHRWLYTGMPLCGPVT